MKYPAALIVAVSAFLQSCASTPNIGAVTNEHIQLWYTQAQLSTTKRLGTSLTDVKLHVLSKDEMRTAHSGLIESQLDKAFKTATRTSIIAHQAQQSLDTLIAVYDPYAKRILVDRENFLDHLRLASQAYIPPEQAAKALLFHELVHANDDRLYDLQHAREINKWSPLSFAAVAEGHAELLTADLCGANDCAEAAEFNQHFFEQLPAVTGSVNLISESGSDNVALKYVQGARFLKHLQQAQSNDAIGQAIFHSAPADTLSIYDYSRYFDNSITESKNRLVALMASDSKGWLANWIEVPGSFFGQSGQPRDDGAKKQTTDSNYDHLLGSVSASYFFPPSKAPVPLNLKFVQARSSELAESEAANMLSIVRHQTSGMLGSELSLKDISTQTDEKRDKNRSKRFFKATIVNQRDNQRSDYRVTVLRHDDTLAEVSTFNSEVLHTSAVKLAKGMLKDYAAQQN